MDVRQDFAKMKPAVRKRVIEAIKWMKKNQRSGVDGATVAADSAGGVYQRYVTFHSQGGVVADLRDFSLALPPEPKTRLHSIVIDGEEWINAAKPPLTDVGLEAFLRGMPITPGGFTGGPFNDRVVIPATHLPVLIAQIKNSPFAAITLRIIPDGATTPIDVLFASAVNPGPKFQLDTYRMAHRSPAFLPWHRVILRLFERDLQFADKKLNNDGKIALPYWNWSRDNDWDEKAKSSVWHKENFGGFSDTVEGTITGNHFAPGSTWELFGAGGKLSGIDGELRRLRKAEQKTASDTLPLPDGAFPTAKAVETVIAQTEYIGDKRGGGGAGDGSGGNHRFAGQLEHALHDFIHPLVGGMATGPRTQDGQMSDGLFSPQDPIFWLFHCNVDRLWSRWQWLHDKSNDSKYPKFGMLPGRRLNDPMEPWAGGSANVPPYEFTVTVKDVLNAANFSSNVNAENLLGKGYKYDTLTL